MQVGTLLRKTCVHDYWEQMSSIVAAVIDISKLSREATFVHITVNALIKAAASISIRGLELRLQLESDFY